MAPSVNIIQDELTNQNSFDSFIDYDVVSKLKLHQLLVGKALVDHVTAIDHENCEAGDENSFFVADLGQVKRAYQRWQQALPQVHPHYAVKCNPDPEVLGLLNRLGVGFDCASKNEIEQVLKMGVDSSKIIYANPCKTNSFIRHARDSQVNMATFDNAQELKKIKQFHPDCQLLLRISTDDSTAVCRLSTKFGCSIEGAVNELLPLAKELDLNVKGVAFHIGSGAKDFDSILTAVRDARIIFDAAIELGLPVSVLDIGGGFQQDSFDEAAGVVNQALNQYFPSEFVGQHSIRFIAEPGRFMVAEAFTLATHVIARRDLNLHSRQANGVEAMIYTNDGVYGNLNCIIFDHARPLAYVLKHKGKSFYGRQPGEYSPHFSIWGPTCDGIDQICDRVALSTDVEVGDWLYFPDMGAYSSAGTTSFNGFEGNAHTVYVDSEQSELSRHD